MMTSNYEKKEGAKCCPSCQLAISKDMKTHKRHLRVGREESEWKQKRKFRLMLALSIIMVLFSVGLVLGVVSHLRVRGRSLTYKHGEPNIHEIQFSYNSEGIKLEDKDLMQDVQTKFVPPAVTYYTIRQKRSTAYADEAHTLQTYRGNVTNDLIIWGVKDTNSNMDALNGGGHVTSSATANQHSQSIEKIHKSITLTEIPSNEEKESPVHTEYYGKDSGETARRNMLSVTNQLPEANSLASQMLMLGEAGTDNKAAANYPDEATDTDYDIDDTQYSREDKDEGVVYSYPVLKEDHKFPWKSAGEDIDDSDHQSAEERQESYSLGQKVWLALQDNAAGEKPDFHTFWKGEGDFHTIRHAQAKVMSSYMDVSADPCQDFYQYACGNWGKINPIPKDKTTYDTFEMLRENLDTILKELLEEQPNTKYHDIAAEEWQNDATTKAKHFFQSCMNYEILKQRAEQPLLNLLNQLGGWPMLQTDWDSSQFDWLLLMAQLRLYNNDILISEWVGPDIKNSNEYVIQFDQTSLGLPTRDYFLQPSNMVYLEAYKNYFIKISTLLGAPLDNVTQEAETLINFETRLAEITSAPDERRNVIELYQRMSIGELGQIVPQVDWARYLSLVLARPINISEPVVVFALNYIRKLVNLLSKTPPRTIANYLLWRFVRNRVNNLDDRFQEAKQQFYHILFGREQAPSRWKTCVAEVNDHLGMALGSMFVHKYFDENSKRDTVQMTEEIMHSFQELLSQTSWIDKETKELAAQKVDAMMLRIGYPDFILNPQLLNVQYEDLPIHPDQYFENVLNILQHLTREEQNLLGTPVNKSLWNTAPAVVNAYYSRSKNQITGILQPPFYHRYFPRSLNYGGIGVVIGHEITHGFDDKGRLFDKDGNLQRWWHDKDIEEFNHRAQCLIDQYSHYTVKEVAMKIDGISTQGENIADNGGIKQAFRAYQRWLNENGDFGETLPGVNATGHQLFFLNFAQIWCGTTRPEATRNKLKIAVHSPGKFRVIGTLSNSEDFASTFKCQLGMPMNPIKKCSVW